MGIFADGQLPAATGTLLDASVRGLDTSVAVSLFNTSGVSTETISLLTSHGGGTNRQLVQLQLAPKERATVDNIPLGPNDILKGSATDATTVDFTVSESSGTGPKCSVTAHDSTGSGKSTTAVSASYTQGAGTAAAGTTTTDAGVLPSATGNVYPTTAADGTKGVRVAAADKVTNRMLFIGNGVSNQILKVYAPSGGTINGAAADAAFSGASGKGVIMYCKDAGTNAWLAW